MALPPPPYETDDVTEFLTSVEMLRDENVRAAIEKLEAAPPELRARPELRLTHADLTWQEQGAAAARPALEALVAAEPDYADARHLLGVVLEELGEESAKIEQFLEVLRLDEGLDEELEGYDDDELEDLIVEVAEDAVLNLPQPFQQKLSGVPILVEARPSEDLVQQGFDPRALGLFDGPRHVDHQNAEASPVPTRIVLYAKNLLAEAVDDEQLREEVETTVLHEVGHYFGLEEDDLARIGLE